MSTAVRWVIGVVVVLVVVGLIAYARGPEHQRGDEVGAMVGVLSTQTATTG